MQLSQFGRPARFLSILLIAGLAQACALLRVTAPLPTDPVARVNGYSRDGNGRLVITITFNEPVKQSSVVVGKTLIVSGQADNNAAGTLAWSPDGKTVTFTSTKTLDQLISPRSTTDAFFTLTIIGTDSGQGAVTDASGNRLDGDYDGTAGGDYKMSFTLIG